MGRNTSERDGDAQLTTPFDVVCPATNTSLFLFPHEDSPGADETNTPVNFRAVSSSCPPRLGSAVGVPSRRTLRPSGDA